MNTEREIKPSFSFKYVILIIITAGIISSIGFLLKPIFVKSIRREIVISKISVQNLINLGKLNESQLLVKYSLKDDPKIEINSFFAQTIILKNSGSEGVENLEITFSVPDTNIELINDPSISTIPAKIIDGLKIKKLSQPNEKQKHIWNVDLLNKNEAIIFDYRAFSKEVVQHFEMNVVPRKKDWVISYKEITESDKEEISFTLPIYIVISIILIGIMITFPIYYKEWIANPELRKNYSSFLKYYWNDTSPVGNYLRKKIVES